MADTADVEASDAPDAPDDTDDEVDDHEPLDAMYLKENKCPVGAETGRPSRDFSPRAQARFAWRKKGGLGNILEVFS